METEKILMGAEAVTEVAFGSGGWRGGRLPEADSLCRIWAAGFDPAFPLVYLISQQLTWISNDSDARSSHCLY